MGFSESGSQLTDSEVKTAYENNADTNAFTDAEQTKLGNIDQGVATTDDVAFDNLALTGQGGTALNTLTDAANIATDCNLGNVHEVVLDGNRTLDNPTNLVSGNTYIWIVKQDATTGSRTLAYGTAFLFPGGTAPTLSTAINSVDLICGVCSGTDLICSFTADFQ